MAVYHIEDGMSSANECGGAGFYGFFAPDIPLASKRFINPIDAKQESGAA